MSNVSVEQHDHQLVVAVSPREGLDVLVAVRADVEQREIGDAINDAAMEVRHTRALSSVDGSERIDDVAPDHPVAVADGGGVSMSEAFDRARDAETLDDARYWSDVALRKWVVENTEDGR